MQKKKLKLKFVDFWYGFNCTDNYFTRILSEKYEIQFSNEPDVLIYSCYGRKYLAYNCIRIYYTSENKRSDFTGCDFAISFDYLHHERHLRLPLYAIYIDQIGKPNKLIAKTNEEATIAWKSKTKFCCMVVSNGGSQKRIDFFNKLNQYKQVDSGGMLLNNVGGAVKDKLKFINDYRFVLSFENSSYPGYTTEKLIEPFMQDCIPIYWGDPEVGREFNKKSFLCLDPCKTDDELIDEIIEIDNNEAKAIEMLCEYKFANNTLPNSNEKKLILDFLSNAIETDRRPVATTFSNWIHFVKIYCAIFKSRMVGIILKIIK